MTIHEHAAPVGSEGSGWAGLDEGSRWSEIAHYNELGLPLQISPSTPVARHKGTGRLDVVQQGFQPELTGLDGLPGAAALYEHREEPAAGLKPRVSEEI